MSFPNLEMVALWSFGLFLQCVKSITKASLKNNSVSCRPPGFLSPNLYDFSFLFNIVHILSIQGEKELEENILSVYLANRWNEDLTGQ